MSENCLTDKPIYEEGYAMAIIKTVVRKGWELRHKRKIDDLKKMYHLSVLKWNVYKKYLGNYVWSIIYFDNGTRAVFNKENEFLEKPCDSLSDGVLVYEFQINSKRHLLKVGTKNKDIKDTIYNKLHKGIKPDGIDFNFNTVPFKNETKEQYFRRTGVYLDKTRN